MLRHAMPLLLCGAFAATAQTPAPDPQPAPAPEPARELGGDVKLYSEASLGLHRQNHRTALELFQSLLDGYPKSPLAPESLYWSGVCQEKLGRADEARRSYDQLLRRFADSPWCQDAKQRLGSFSVPSDAGTWRVRFRDGTESQGPVMGLGREQVRLKDRSAPWTDVTEVVRVGGESPADVLVLEGGDRLSARIVRACPDGFECESPLVGKLTLPRQRVARIELGGHAPAAGAWSLAMEPTLFTAPAEGDVFMLGGEPGVAMEGGAIVLEEGDDPVVILRQTEDDDGQPKKDVRVVVRKGEGGDGHRAVIVVRPDGAEERRFELKLDDLELDGDLERLPERIEEEVRKRVGDLDLDLDLDLRKVEKALRDAPAEARDKVREVLKRRMKDGGEHFDRMKKEHAEHVDKAKHELQHAKALKEKHLAQAHEHLQHLEHATKDGHLAQFYKLAQPGQLNDVFAWSAAGGAERRADADRVVLENGDVLSGDLVRVDGERVQLKTSWGDLSIDRKQVSRIVFRGQEKKATTTNRRFALGAAPVPPVPPIPPTPVQPPRPRQPMQPAQPLPPGALPTPRAGAAARPFLGINAGQHDRGVLVEQVHPGTPAAEAGLEEGDVILELDGAPLREPGQLIEQLGQRQVGQDVTLVIQRGEDRLKRRVKLAARRSAMTEAVPAQPAPPTPRAPRVAPAPPAPPTPPPPPQRRPRRASNDQGSDEEEEDGQGEGSPRHF